MTTPDRPTEPWTPTDAAVEAAATPAAFESGTVPVAARLPITTAARRSPGPSSRLVNIVLGLAAVVAIGGVAFAAGRMTAPATTTAGGNGGNGRLGNGQFPGGFVNGTGGGGAGFGGGAGGAGFLRGAGVLEGTIVSSTSTSITLQINVGASGGQGIQIVIPLSSSTTVHTQAAATTGDLAAGQKVLVQLGTAAPGATNAPAASGAPREIQVPAKDVTIVAP